MVEREREGGGAKEGDVMDRQRGTDTHMDLWTPNTMTSGIMAEGKRGKTGISDLAIYIPLTVTELTKFYSSIVLF